MTHAADHQAEYPDSVDGTEARNLDDGRERPPAFAAHTWAGFSTGEYRQGQLIVKTTHLKGRLGPAAMASC
jgi:hypothetical protein